MLVTKSFDKLPLFGRVDARVGPFMSSRKYGRTEPFAFSLFLVFSWVIIFGGCVVVYRISWILNLQYFLFFFMFDFFCSHSDERLGADLCSGSVDNSASIRLVPSLFWECNTQLMKKDISIFEKFEKFNHHLMFFLYLDISSVPIWTQAYHIQFTGTCW